MKNNVNADNPKVTIITITKDLIKNEREEFLKKCIESVHGQTYKNIEYIVIDGASADGTLDLIKEYEDKGWLKCYSQKDNGIDDAYNKGLAKATGKYVAFMNSDDAYYSNDVIEISVKKLEEENADYSYGKEKRIDRNGKFNSIWKPKPEVFYVTMPFSHQTMLVKKAVMQKLGNYNTDCGFGGDYCLILQLILNDYKGVEIPQIISLYRLGGISSQSDDLKGRYKVLYVMAKRVLWLYNQFYEDLTIEMCVNIQCFGSYPPYFLQKLIRFMVEKDLKNFDYNTFINYINTLINPTTQEAFSEKKTIDYKLLGFLNVLRIRIKNAKKMYRLFGFIPLLTIQHTGNKTIYRLFGFLPFLQVKHS